MSKKIRVNAQNQKQIECLIGEKVFINDIVYLPYEEETEIDLIGIICQEYDNYLSIWDEVNGMTVDSNLFHFDLATVKEFEPVLENMLLTTMEERN